MTTNEAKQTATKFVNSHVGSVVLGLVGMAVAASGWVNPDAADKIVNAGLGLILTMLAGFNSTRVGTAKDADKLAEKTEQDKRELKDEIRTAVPDDSVLKTLNTTVLEMIGGMERIQNNIDAKHDENKKSNEDQKAANDAILEALATYKDDNERSHQEHRDAIAELRDNHKTLAAGLGEVKDELHRIADRLPSEAA